MKLVITAILFICVSPLSAQIKSANLLGEWTACNKDSLYHRSETVVLYQDANYYVQAKCCHYVNWKIRSKKKMRIENSFVCTEPGRVNSSTLKETYKVVNCEDGQMIVLKRGKAVIDKFKVVNLQDNRVERYPYDIKILTLKRL